MYRALELLHDHELVKRLDPRRRRLPGTRWPTRRASTTITFVCDRCGRLVAFDDPALERAIGEVSERLGARVEQHEVVLRGACGDCG